MGPLKSGKGPPKLHQALILAVSLGNARDDMPAARQKNEKKKCSEACHKHDENVQCRLMCLSKRRAKCAKLLLSYLCLRDKSKWIIFTNS